MESDGREEGGEDVAVESDGREEGGEDVAVESDGREEGGGGREGGWGLQVTRYR